MAHCKEIDRATAAAAFEVAARMNPQGYEPPQSMAARGDNFELSTDTGRGIYGVCKDGELLWCIAAAGQGSGLARAGLDCLEKQARANACKRVGFQTMRRGLVRIAKQQGYAVTRQVGAGYVLEKEV